MSGIQFIDKLKCVSQHRTAKREMCACGVRSRATMTARSVETVVSAAGQAWLPQAMVLVTQLHSAKGFPLLNKMNVDFRCSNHTHTK